MYMRHAWVCVRDVGKRERFEVCVKNGGGCMRDVWVSDWLPTN